MPDCLPNVIIIHRPQPITAIIPKPSIPKVVVAKQILRGQRGATDITAIAPLELNNNDELRLSSLKLLLILIAVLTPTIQLVMRVNLSTLLWREESAGLAVRS